MPQLTLCSAARCRDSLHRMEGTDLAVADREFVVIVDPSGCGDTALLRMVAGLEEITGSDFVIDGVRGDDISPEECSLVVKPRQMGAQQPAEPRDVGADQRDGSVSALPLAVGLQPCVRRTQMTVADAISFAPKMATATNLEIRDEVMHATRVMDREAARAASQSAGRRPAATGRERAAVPAQTQGGAVQRAVVLTVRGAAGADGQAVNATMQTVRVEGLVNWIVASEGGRCCGSTHHSNPSTVRSARSSPRLSARAE